MNDRKIIRLEQFCQLKKEIRGPSNPTGGLRGVHFMVNRRGSAASTQASLPACAVGCSRWL